MSEFKARITAELDTSKLEQDIKNLDGKIKIGVDTGKGAEDIGKVDKSIHAAKKTSKSFGQTLKKSLNIGSAATITAKGFRLINTTAKDAYKAVKDMDSALSQLQIVTEASDHSIKRYASDAVTAAKEIGASITEITKSTETFARLGYSLNDSLNLSKLAAQYSNVAAITQDDATKSITSIMKAFNVDPSMINSVLDKLVKVGQEYAISASELGQALQNGGAALEAGGNTLEESIALLAAGNAAVQNASAVGNALKVTSMRIRSSTAELDEMGETVDELVKSASNYRAEIKALSGVDIMLNENTYKSTYQILEEIANVWDNLNDIQQATLLEDLAGKRNANTIKSVITNLQDLKGAYQAANNAAGTLAKANETYMDSIAAKTKVLQASFEQLSIDTLDSGLIKSIFDAANAIVVLLDKSNLLKGTLTGFAVAGIIKAFTSLKIGITSASIRLNEFNAALKMVKAGNIGENEIQQLAKMTANLSQNQLKAVLSSKSLSAEQRLSILTTQGMSQAEAQAMLSTMGLATAEGTATGATATLSGALKGLWATLIANPLTLIISAVTLISSVFMTVSQEVKQAEEEARQAMIQLGESAADTVDEIEEAYQEFAKYNKLVGTSDEDSSKLNNAIDTLNKTLGDNRLAFENAAEGADNYANSINSALSASLNDALIDAKKAVAAAREELKDSSYNWFTGSKVQFEYGNSVQKQNGYSAEKQIISDILGDKYTKEKIYSSHGISTTAYIASPKDIENMDDVVDYYYKLLEVQDKLAEQNLTDTDTYRSVTTTLQKMQSGVESYVNAKYNELKLEYEVANGIPTTVDEYNKLINSIESTTSANEGLTEQLKILAKEDWADKIDFTPQSDASDAVSTIDKATAKLNEFRNVINKLKSATDEYNNTGFVSAETYNELIELNKDYADLFDFSSGKISIAADEVDRLVEELIAEYGATLAANGATEAQITQMVALAKSLSNVKEEVDDVVDSIKDLADILQDAVDGTEMTVFETWELLENYPELASAITKTTNGYILEEAAVRELIKAKAELLGMEASEARMAARDNLINNAKNVESANNVDKIFADYYNKNGTNIKSFDEYVSAWEDYYGKTASGNWVNGLQEYVEAIISDNSVNNVMNSLIEDMKNPDSLLKTKIEENPISNAFDELESIYSGRLQELEYLTNTYNNAIKSLENQGYDVPASYYEKLKEVEEEKIALLGDELTALTGKFQEAINAGEIEEGSKEFYDMNNAINSVKESIQASNLALQEYSNTIRDIEWKKFDDIQEEIKKITEESEFLLDLLDDKDMVDKAGKLTEYGNAAMGLHGVNYNVYMEQAQRYADEIAKIEEELANDQYNQNLIDRKEELLELQRESVLAAEEEKQAMVDLVKEGIEAELDALDDLIDKYKDALDSAKDLYDYQNKVSDITEKIGTLQKQIIAYENDTSEETKAQIQKLKVDLQKAQEELQETEYDQFIADQKKLLDNLYDDYETILNRRLDDVDTLIVDSIDAINNNAADIKTTLETTASSVGVTLSNKMGSIWTITDECKTVVTDYSANFDSATGEVNSNLGTVNLTLSEIDDYINSVDKGIGDVNESVGGLAGKLDEIKTAIGEIDNSGDASNPDGSGGIGDFGGGSNIKDYAPNTIYTDPGTNTNTNTEDEKELARKKAQDYLDSHGMLEGDRGRWGQDPQFKSLLNDYISKGGSLNDLHGKTPTIKGNTGEKVKLTTGKLNTIDYSVSGLNKASAGWDDCKVTIDGQTFKVATYDSEDKTVDTTKQRKLNDLFGGTQPSAGTLAGLDGVVYVVSKDGGWVDFADKNQRSAMTEAFFNKLNAYKDGGLADYTGLAWIDGTKSKPEGILDAEDTQNFIALRDILAQLASDDIGFGNPLYSSFAPMSYGNNIPNFGEKLAQILNSYGETKVENHFEITIPIEKVEDYNDFVTQLRDDPKFEKMVQAMTLGRLNGGSPNAKYNYSWKNK